MKSRKDVLESEGYTVCYRDQEKYRGNGDIVKVCFASKSGEEFVAVSDSQNVTKLQAIQSRIPHMVPIAARYEDIFLFRKASGRLLWETDLIDNMNLVENQLHEFANATSGLGMAHADIRPWNIYYDPGVGVQVIDWGFAIFPDVVGLSAGILNHLSACKHTGHKTSEIDKYDVVDAVRLM